MPPTHTAMLAWFSPALPHITELEAAWETSSSSAAVASLEAISRGACPVSYFFHDPFLHCTYAERSARFLESPLVNELTEERIDFNVQASL